MAGWLSSKLKEAEQFLQQIDQQAAESLGKPEKQKSTDLKSTIEERNGTFAGKTRERSEFLYANQKDVLRQASLVEKHEQSQPSFSGLRKPTKSAHGHKGLGSIPRSELKDPRVSGTKQQSSMIRNVEESEQTGKDDWTELLASPNINLVSSPALSSSVGSSDSGGSVYFGGASSRIPSGTGKNGGHIQQSASSRTFSVRNPSRHVPLESSRTKPPAADGLMGSEMVVPAKNFRHETLRRRLELDTSYITGAEEDLKELVINDAASTTGSHDIGEIDMNGHITDAAGDVFLKWNSDLASEKKGSIRFDSPLDQTRALREIKEVSELIQNAKDEMLQSANDEMLGKAGKSEMESTNIEAGDMEPFKEWQSVRQEPPDAALEFLEYSSERTSKLDRADECGYGVPDIIGQLSDVKIVKQEPMAGFEESSVEEEKKLKGNVIVNLNESIDSGETLELNKERPEPTDTDRESLGLTSKGQLKELEIGGGLGEKSRDLTATKMPPVFLESDVESYGSGTETDTESGSGSESEDEEIERRKSDHKRRIAKRKALAAARAAAAQAAIHEREEFVGKLEKEKDALERTLAEREEQQVREATELRMSVMEVFQALDLEKQQHSSTRMKALAKESQLENENAELAKSLGAVQWDLEEQIARVSKARSMVEAKEVIKAELERRLAKLRHELWSTQQTLECQLAGGAKVEEFSFEEEQAGLWRKIEQCQIQVKELERKIGDLKDSRRVLTETEVELENRLCQLADHLIQKQAQVEALSTEKATLVFRLEAVSNALQEERAIALTRASRGKKGILRSSDWTSFDEDLEYGLSRPYNSKNKPFVSVVEESVATGGNVDSLSFFPLLRQLDAVFSAGIFYLRRHRWAQVFALVYLLGLHLWVMFILFMESKPNRTFRLQDLVLPKNISESLGGSNTTNFL